MARAPQFQFHKGTIRTKQKNRKNLADNYFNSIKVRLEPIVLLIIADYRLFQFHKGTIRTPDRLISAISSHIFQFHKGTIRTPKCRMREST